MRNILCQFLLGKVLRVTVLLAWTLTLNFGMCQFLLGKVLHPIHNSQSLITTRRCQFLLGKVLQPVEVKKHWYRKPETVYGVNSS